MSISGLFAKWQSCIVILFATIWTQTQWSLDNTMSKKQVKNRQNGTEHTNVTDSIITSGHKRSFWSLKISHALSTNNSIITLLRKEKGNQDFWRKKKVPLHKIYKLNNRKYDCVKMRMIVINEAAILHNAEQQTGSVQTRSLRGRKHFNCSLQQWQCHFHLSICVY